MLGYLAGSVVAKLKHELIVEVGGVGYRIRVGIKVWEETSLNEEVKLFIHTAVREDAITLYGFREIQELQMFELLIEVSGVGPKTAMTITGSQCPAHIESAVRQADVGFFQKVPGIGKKSAQRIIVDLKGKMPSLKDLDLNEPEVDEEVLMALKQFGFREKEIEMALTQIDHTMPLEAKVREGLKLLGKG